MLGPPKECRVPRGGEIQDERGGAERQDPPEPEQLRTGQEAEFQHIWQPTGRRLQAQLQGGMKEKLNVV